MSKQEIEQFLAEKHIGFAGVSRQPSKFGNQVYRKLKETGCAVNPVHLQANSLEGDACVADISQLPPEVQALMVVAGPDVCAKVLSEVPQTRISKVWVFSGKARADVDLEIQRLRDSGVSVIAGHCPFMYLEPVTSVHSFHRFIVRLLGRYPR